jgi:hypothetical protein
VFELAMTALVGGSAIPENCRFFNSKSPSSSSRSYVFPNMLLSLVINSLELSSSPILVSLSCFSNSFYAAFTCVSKSIVTSSSVDSSFFTSRVSRNYYKGSMSCLWYWFLELNYLVRITDSIDESFYLDLNRSSLVI